MSTEQVESANINGERCPLIKIVSGKKIYMIPSSAKFACNFGKFTGTQRDNWVIAKSLSDITRKIGKTKIAVKAFEDGFYSGLDTVVLVDISSDGSFINQHMKRMRHDSFFQWDDKLVAALKKFDAETARLTSKRAKMREKLKKKAKKLTPELFRKIQLAEQQRQEKAALAAAKPKGREKAAPKELPKAKVKPEKIKLPKAKAAGVADLDM